jgi:hypothetical protein
MVVKLADSFRMGEDHVAQSIARRIHEQLMDATTMLRKQRLVSSTADLRTRTPSRTRPTTRSLRKRTIRCGNFVTGGIRSVDLTRRKLVSVALGANRRLWNRWTGTSSPSRIADNEPRRRNRSNLNGHTSTTQRPKISDVYIDCSMHGR